MRSRSHPMRRQEEIQPQPQPHPSLRKIFNSWLTSMSTTLLFISFYQSLSKLRALPATTTTTEEAAERWQQLRQWPANSRAPSHPRQALGLSLLPPPKASLPLLLSAGGTSPLSPSRLFSLRRCMTPSNYVLIPFLFSSPIFFTIPHLSQMGLLHSPSNPMVPTFFFMKFSMQMSFRDLLQIFCAYFNLLCL